MPCRMLSKGHVHLAPNHGISFPDLPAAFILDTNSDSHCLALNMNFDDVEERDGLKLSRSRADRSLTPEAWNRDKTVLECMAKFKT